MSSYSLNTIRKSYVSEQACLPLCFPDKGCVFNPGEKGSVLSVERTSDSFESSSVEFLTILWAHLMKCFSKVSLGKLFVPVSDSVHGIFNGIKGHGIGLCFDLGESLFKSLMFFFLFCKKVSKGA